MLVGVGTQPSKPQENGDAPKATGGWGPDFLAKNKAINAESTAAIEKAIAEEAAGKAPAGDVPHSQFSPSSPSCPCLAQSHMWLACLIATPMWHNLIAGEPEASSKQTFSFGVPAMEAGFSSQAPAAGIFNFGGAAVSKAATSEGAPAAPPFSFGVQAVSEAATSEAAPAAHPFSGFGMPAASKAPLSEALPASQAIMFGGAAASKAGFSEAAPAAMPFRFEAAAATTADALPANEMPAVKSEAVGQPSGDDHCLFSYSLPQHLSHAAA